MKKLMTLAAAAIIAAFSGCKTVPTVDVMKSTAYAVGCAGGLVANETKIDDKSRNAIIEVIALVRDVVPEDGHTFQEAWTVVARVYADKLIQDGKIDQGQAALIVNGVAIAATGVDYLFTRYPKAKKYEELVAAAISGFSDGFLATFKPVNLDSAPDARRSVVEYDKDAYVYIKQAFTVK